MPARKLSAGCALALSIATLIAGLGSALLIAMPAAARQELTPESRAEADRLNEAALGLHLEQWQRTLRVADRLRLAGLALCDGDRSPVFGMVALSDRSIPEGASDWVRERAVRFWELEDGRVRVLWVEPGSAAADAGILAGDRVLRVDGEKVRKSQTLGARPSKSRTDDYLFRIERGGRELEFVVPYRPGCFAPGGLVWSRGAFLRAGAGGSATISTAALDFVHSDDELAILIGFELGHEILGEGRWARSDERAEYIGLYLAARAGYDVSVAPALQERVAKRYPLSLYEWNEQRGGDLWTTPESWHASVLAMNEIQQKRAAGQPLLPEDHPPALDDESVERLREGWKTGALESYYERQARLELVASRVRRAGVEHCGDDVGPALGLAMVPWVGLRSFWYVLAVEDDFRAKEVRVTRAVTAPGKSGGVLAEDILLEAHGKSPKEAGDLAAILRRHAKEPVRLRVRRGDEELSLELPYVPVCHYEVALRPMQSPSSGRIRENHMWISTGMLELAESDDDLAFVVAHELAHRIFGDRATNHQAHELDADRLAVQIARAAGYDPSGAPELLERLGLLLPMLIEWPEPGETGSKRPPRHGRIAERRVAMRKILGTRTP